MADIIKKDAKIIKEIFDKEKKINFFNHIENLSVSLALLNVVLFTISLFFIDLTFENRFLASVFGGLVIFLLSLFINFNLIEIYNNRKNKKYLQKSGSLFLSNNYLISKEKKEEIYKLHKKLSKNGVEAISYLNYMNLRDNDLKKIEMLVLRRKVILMDLNLFINYFKNDFQLDKKEIEIDEEELIYSKIYNILENIKEADFNEFKEDIIHIIETLKSKKNQLKLFELIEELKEKYDEGLLNEKINLIKNKVIPKKEENNKVLKSI